MKYLLLSIFLLGISSTAQDYTIESLLQKKGILNPDEPVFNLTKYVENDFNQIQ